jgi:hypothetical protein
MQLLYFSIMVCFRRGKDTRYCTANCHANATPDFSFRYGTCTVDFNGDGFSSPSLCVSIATSHLPAIHFAIDGREGWLSPNSARFTINGWALKLVVACMRLELPPLLWRQRRSSLPALAECLITMMLTWGALHMRALSCCWETLMVYRQGCVKRCGWGWWNLSLHVVDGDF